MRVFQLCVAGLNLISVRVRLRTDTSPQNIIDYLSTLILSLSLSLHLHLSIPHLSNPCVCVSVFGGHTPWGQLHKLLVLKVSHLFLLLQDWSSLFKVSYMKS